MAREHDPLLEEALQQLADEDSVQADLAREALALVAFGEGLAEITQYGLQEFVWLQLPVTIDVDVSRKLAMVKALGKMLDLAGFERYAALCLSPFTSEMVQLHAQRPRRAMAEFRRAMDRSGVEPPNLAGFTWGETMGIEEASALWSVAGALELAIAAGDLKPGVRGWRSAQRELTAAHLDMPRADLGGRTFRNAILTERVDWWATGRGEARRTMLGGIVDRLLEAPQVPADARESVSVLRWLLQRAGDGLALQGAGRLATAVHADAAHDLGWTDTDGQPSPLDDLAVVGIRSRILRRSGQQLVRTRFGTATMQDTAALWRAAAGGLAAGADLRSDVSELVLACVLQRGRARVGELVADVQHAVGHDRSSGSRDAVAGHIESLVCSAKALHMIAEQRDTTSRSIGLTPGGQMAAVEALRRRATGPRSA